MLEDVNILSLLMPKKDMAYIDASMNVKQTLEKMRTTGYLAIPVIAKTGEYLGSITEGDLLWPIVDDEMDEDDMEDTSIIDFIRKDYSPAVKVDDIDIRMLSDMLIRQNYVPIIDDRNILMGIVTRRKLLETIFEKNSI